MSEPHKPKGFFPISRYRLISTIVVLALCVLAINPYTFNTQVAGTAIINWLMVGIMIVALAVMIIDLFITPSPKDEAKSTNRSEDAAVEIGEARG